MTRRDPPETGAQIRAAVAELEDATVSFYGPYEANVSACGTGLIVDTEAEAPGADHGVIRAFLSRTGELAGELIGEDTVLRPRHHTIGTFRGTHADLETHAAARRVVFDRVRAIGALHTLWTAAGATVLVGRRGDAGPVQDLWTQAGARVLTSGPSEDAGVCHESRTQLGGRHYGVRVCGGVWTVGALDDPALETAWRRLHGAHAERPGWPPMPLTGPPLDLCGALRAVRAITGQ